jgi:sugar phosphate isomerase/epimerase
MTTSRRNFIKKSLAATFSLSAIPATSLISSGCSGKNMFFSISIAEWSLHRAIRSGNMTNLDFHVKARKDFNIEAIEYVNTLFESHDEKYLQKLDKRCKDNDVKSLLIMVDAEGNLGNTNTQERIKSVENHYKWVEAAKLLGCHSIRVNARGSGTKEEVADAAIDGLGRLTEHASKEKINVIVENHGGYSSIGTWLANVIEKVNSPYCGTLPDFGNFRISNDPEKWYDKYKGVKELMPYAKGVSAKSHQFDENGNEVNTDYKKMLKIVKDAGYTGYIGIEYEGSELSEDEGIMATKKLLEKIGKELSH